VRDLTYLAKGFRRFEEAAKESWVLLSTTSAASLAGVETRIVADGAAWILAPFLLLDSRPGSSPTRQTTCRRPRLDRYGSIFCACQPSMYPYPLRGLFHDMRRSYLLSLIDCHIAHKLGVSHQILLFAGLSSLQAHTSLINYHGGRGQTPEDRGIPLRHSLIKTFG
jgi:hypothetical protein